MTGFKPNTSVLLILVNGRTDCVRENGFQFASEEIVSSMCCREETGFRVMSMKTCAHGVWTWKHRKSGSPCFHQLW